MDKPGCTVRDISNFCSITQKIVCAVSSVLCRYSKILRPDRRLPLTYSTDEFKSLLRDFSAYSLCACNLWWQQLHEFRYLFRQFCCIINIGRIILCCIDPLLGNGSVNTFPTNTSSTIGRPLLGNRPINTLSWQRTIVFPWRPCRGVIRGHSQMNWRSTTEYKGAVE
jgi:hypothetical protein